jgi:hypothetical protein
MTVIRPLHVAVILLGVIEILQGASVSLSKTAQLIIAIVAVILVVLDLFLVHPRPTTTAP